MANLESKEKVKQDASLFAVFGKNFLYTDDEELLLEDIKIMYHLESKPEKEENRELA